MDIVIGMDVVRLGRGLEGKANRTCWRIEYGGGRDRSNGKEKRKSMLRTREEKKKKKKEIRQKEQKMFYIYICRKWEDV